MTAIIVIAWVIGSWTVGWILAKYIQLMNQDADFDRNFIRGLWVLSPTVAGLLFLLGIAFLVTACWLNANGADRLFRRIGL